ncbi:50S ribosomal protein L25 [Candidatus Gracilibacteria bacterium]|nr:MAG: 50S ribosomal protein L25 [Candidatus Gracilibacteria bacterium]PIE85091.1 MAG: 50S ribosomal protein L25 [Candidatus Gracilibacteria bacterium]
MKKLELNAEIREKGEDLKKLRASKIIPAVVYGNNQEPISFKMNNSDFLRTFRVSGESHIINLKIGKKTIEVLVHQIQKDPVTGAFLHVDFYAITKGEKLTTKIHLNFVGESEAAKLGAIIEENMKEIEVKCLPKDLVDSFDVDISVLKEFGDSVKVSDLNISDAYQVNAPADEIVISSSKPAKAEDLDAPVVAPEVEGEEANASEETK